MYESDEGHGPDSGLGQGTPLCRPGKSGRLPDQAQVLVIQLRAVV